MVRRIIIGVVVLVLIFICYEGYVTWKTKRAMLSGDVVSGPSEPLPGGTSVPLPTPSVIQRVTQAVRPATEPTQQAATYPATDSQSPNAPDGAKFAGAGRYQVYRQGNLTYRIDTNSGRTCVLYATEEEWRKPEVYRHGCGNSAAQ